MVDGAAAIGGVCAGLDCDDGAFVVGFATGPGR
jgi:hypothetical protein